MMHFPEYETCVRLKEAGFPQTTLFYYFPKGEKYGAFYCTEMPPTINPDCSAPMLTELLEEIVKFNPPNMFKLQGGTEGKWLTRLVSKKEGEDWNYSDAHQGMNQEIVEAAAECYLRLKEAV